MMFLTLEWTKSMEPVIQRLQVRILWEDNFFALLVLSSRRSGGSSLGFRAMVAFRPEARKTIKQITCYFFWEITFTVISLLF